MLALVDSDDLSPRLVLLPHYPDRSIDWLTQERMFHKGKASEYCGASRTGLKVSLVSRASARAISIYQHAIAALLVELGVKYVSAVPGDCKPQVRLFF
jgi:hypothetical protein